MSTAPGRNLIEQWEGKVLKVYLDKYGYPTAGVGHLLSADERSTFPVGTPISEDQCAAWLDADLRHVDDAINRLGVPLNENQVAALESLLFNAGVGMLTGQAPKLKAALLQQDWQTAAHEFLDVCHATDQSGHRVVDKGLQNRRKCEAALFLKPVALGQAPIDSEQVLALVGLTLDEMRRGLPI